MTVSKIAFVLASVASIALLTSVPAHAQPPPGGVVGGVPSGQPPPPPPGLAPVRVGGNIPPPTKIRDVKPVYPAIAQSARMQGVVIIEATIGVDGSVTNAKVMRSIPLLDEAALSAVRQWQFTPTLLNGVPVPVIMTTTVNFTIASPNLAARPCAEEKSLQRADTAVTMPTAIHFYNRADAARKIFRLTPDGKRQFSLTIEPQGNFEQTAAAGEPWIVTDARDACVAIFVATAQKGTATIR